MIDLSTINQLEEMEKKATGGRWFYDGICYVFSDTEDNNEMILEETSEVIRMRGFGAGLPLEKNAELIVSLRNNAPSLLAMARYALEHGYNDVGTKIEQGFGRAIKKLGDR